jgi:hypothetical protein
MKASDVLSDNTIDQRLLRLRIKLARERQVKRRKRRSVPLRGRACCKAVSRSNTGGLHNLHVA